MEKVKRYLVFLVGLFVNSLGVSLITRADLGTSPISSIPYVLSLNFPPDVGRVYHCIQSAADRSANSSPWEA